MRPFPGVGAHPVFHGRLSCPCGKAGILNESVWSFSRIASGDVHEVVRGAIKAVCFKCSLGDAHGFTFRRRGYSECRLASPARSFRFWPYDRPPDHQPFARFPRDGLLVPLAPGRDVADRCRRPRLRHGRLVQEIHRAGPGGLRSSRRVGRAGSTPAERNALLDRGSGRECPDGFSGGGVRHPGAAQSGDAGVSRLPSRRRGGPRGLGTGRHDHARRLADAGGRHLRPAPSPADPPLESRQTSGSA